MPQTRRQPVPVRDATAKQLVKEIKKGVDLLEKLVVGPTRVEQELVGETFTLDAGPAFDEPVFRIEVTGPVDDTTTVLLRQDGEPVALSEKERTESSLVAEVKLSDLGDGTCVAVLEHNGEQVDEEEIELVA